MTGQLTVMRQRLPEPLREANTPKRAERLTAARDCRSSDNRFFPTGADQQGGSMNPCSNRSVCTDLQQGHDRVLDGCDIARGRRLELDNWSSDPLGKHQRAGWHALFTA